MTQSTLRQLTGCLAISLAALPALTAQCGLDWLPGLPAGGPSGSVLAVLPLPNGDIVAGGFFRVADTAEVHNIARFDGANWRAMNSGADDTVTCLVRLPGGDIVAGGTFTVMGGQPCSRIARWNGAVWSPIGTGFDGTVRALLALPNGELVAGGEFLAAGALEVDHVARWNGTAWTAIGAGFPGWSAVQTLTRLPNGDLVAAGQFLGGTASGLFRYDGAAWSNIAGFDPSAFASVASVATLANGALAVAGSFLIGGSQETLAIWNGTTMQPLRPPGAIHTPVVLGAANGEVVIGGVGNAGANLARYNGVSWRTIAGGPRWVGALAEDASGRLLVGASVVSSGDRSVARFDGVAWQAIGAPLPPVVQDVVHTPEDSVIVSGSFQSFGGVAANNLARWDGSNWSPLGLGVDGPAGAMAVAGNGDLVVAGSFQNAGGAPANRIARWNGSVWSTLGAGLPTQANALAVAPNGDVFAMLPGIPATLGRFDGGNWTALQVPLLTGLSLAFLPNGDLAIGGTLFANGAAGSFGLAIYSGGTFTLVPGSPLGIRQMLVDAAGTLFVASTNGIGSWDGSSWTSLLSGDGHCLALLPNGDLAAGGAPQLLTGSTVASALYRRMGNGWENLGTIQDGLVRRLAVTGRGEVFATGSFTLVGGAVASGFAEANATCQATAQVVGSGCSGGAGPVTLQVRNRPWVGGTLQSIATGMTNNSLALQLVGVQPWLAPLPGGAAGCSLFVNTLFATTLVPAAGIAAGTFVVPPQPSLAGLTFRMQVVGIELGAFGIVRLTSSNALQLTIGVL